MPKKKDAEIKKILQKARESTKARKYSPLSKRHQQIYKAAVREASLKPLKLGKRYSKAKPAKAVGVVAKKTLGKAIGKAIAKKLPYVGAAIIARDVVKGLSPYACRKRGGKWSDGKCVEGKRKSKAEDVYSPEVRDPISKR